VSETPLQTEDVLQEEGDTLAKKVITKPGKKERKTFLTPKKKRR
jgi:hypothetical protein